MPRTAVTLETFSTSGAAITGVVADTTNDHVVTLPSGVPLEDVVLRFTNTSAADRIVTIKAGAYPPALASGLGDLNFTVPATSGDVFVAGLESSRYIQADGTVNIDLAVSYTGRVYAVRVPR